MNSKYNPHNKKRLQKNDVERVFDACDLCRVIRSHGEKIAFRYFVNGEIQEMRYDAFADLILQAAAAFDKLKLVDKRIVIIGDTSPEWLASYIAAIACGAVAVPMDKELALPEIEKFMASVDTAAVVYGKSFNDKFVTTIGSHCTVKYFIPIDADYGKDFNKKVLPFGELLELGQKALANGYVLPVHTDRDKLSEMLFTSGTTGTSKCVMLSQKNIYSVVMCAALETNVTNEDVVVSVLPVHHTYELACLQAELVLGVTICINDSLRHVMRNFKTFQPTALVLVPLFVNTMYKKIWSEAEKSGRAGKLRTGQKLCAGLMHVGIDVRRKVFRQVIDAFGGRLTNIICGGARLDPKMIEGFESFGISIFEGFGITECAPLTAVTPYYARKYGSVGPAVNCCTIRIEGDGSKTDDGFEQGEIQIKGDNVMLGYYKNEEATREAFTDDGWFRTGDIGYMDADGYVYITGRLKSVIVLENGKNVFPEEIEEYLGGLEEINECVVVGRHSASGDEVVLTAVIYPDLTRFAPEATDAQITEELRKKINAINRTLPAFKQVRAVEIRRTEFEKTTSRKIKRHLVV